MAWRVCSRPGCPTLHEGIGRCPDCRAAGDRARRPTGNPYSSKGHRTFREGVLAKHPRCVCTGECGRHDGLCARRSTVADHWPRERAELVDDGLNPDDPQRGRGLCASCHGGKTARTRPAGFNDRV
ncbi:hypothetical protein GCM10027059_25960 [Myceligenerans halotolerans]